MKLPYDNKLTLLTAGLIYRKPLFVLRGILRFMQNRFRKGHFLSAVSFATTYDCDFDCIHCYAKSFRKTDKEPLSLEDKKNVIRECLTLGAISFDFVGGEISLSDELEELVKTCKPRMTYISLATNAYNLNLQKLKKFRSWGIDKLSVSIDSWDPAKHDNFRNTPGSHKKCFQVLELCRKVGIQPTITTTIIKNSTKSEEFKDLVNFAVKSKIQLVFSTAIPFGNWEENYDILVTEDDLMEMKRLHRLYPFLTRDNYTNMSKCGCPAFKQGLYVTEYGDVLPCAFTHIAFGNVKKESIRSIRKRALTLDYFKKYHPQCLASEDKSFITKYLSKTYSVKDYPANAIDVFEERSQCPPHKMTRRNIKKTLVRCALCGENDTQIISSGREHEFENTTDDIFHVVKCKKCGLIYLNPQPSISEFDTIYPDNYYCHTAKPLSIAGKNSPFGVLKQKLTDNIGFPKNIRNLIKKYYTNEDINVIDIGCGIGSALDIFKKAGGVKIKTYGVDCDNAAALTASKKGHSIYEGSFEEIELPEGFFDMAYSSNVIEHVSNPAEFIEKICSALKPNGIFLCETPNIDSIEARLLAKSGHWGGYHFPRHWTFFTTKQLIALGKQNGLEVLIVNYSPAPIFWIWTFHSLVFNAFKNRKIADFLFPLLENNKNFIYSFFLKINFTAWDYIIKLFTGHTSLVCVTFKKK